VTAVRPDDIELPGTATDLCRDTWMLSGSSVMENGTTIKNNYPCDLDSLDSGVRIGVVRSTDKTLEFYRDGVPQGHACVVSHSTLYAVVDLYGQCAQVSIPCVSPLAPLPANLDNCPRSDTSISLQAVSVLQPPIQTDLHIFSDCHGKGVTLGDGGRLAKRVKDLSGAVVCSATPLMQEELYEISIVSLVQHLAGSVVVGVSEIVPGKGSTNPMEDCCCITGNELRYKNKTIQLFTPSLNWLNVGDRIGLLLTQDAALKIFINSEELALCFPPLPETLYVVIDLRGSCSAVAVTSHKAPLSPLNSMRMQDSLELAQEQVESAKESVLEVATSTVYEFHENHGRNIEIVEGRTTARRVASYNQGVVIASPALEVNSKVQIIIDQLEPRWQSSLIVGVVSGPPERLNLPVNALAFKAPCCIVANDWISINGIKSRSNYGQRLSNLSVGDTVGVMLTDLGLKLLVNGVEEEVLAFVFQTGHAIYAVFDLYGQCQQVGSSQPKIHFFLQLTVFR
jgi:neuralized-like protein 4